MTQEEKAKAYDEVLNKLRHFIAKGVDPLITRADVQDFFPELKESEDEKVRKELIRFIKNWKDTNNIGRPHDLPTLTRNVEQCDRYIAWLEKQGEQIDTANKEYWRGYREGKKLILDKYAETEKQNGQDILEDAILDGNEDGLIAETIKYKHEKQSEQKSDKVEPKFKVGDWIANDYCVGKVIALTDDAYLLDSGQGIPFSCEHNAHLWTIQDAKSGDVLSNGKMIVIFKHFEEPSYRQHIVAYIGLDRGGDIQITDDTWRLGIDKTKPATKEQRDLLFRKMNEAGYEWDAEKKELKKIEKRSSWSEEDEKMMAAIEHHLNNCGASIKSILWLKSLKDRVQPKQEYSEEDVAKLSDFDKALLTAVGTILKNPQVYEDSASKLEEFILGYSTKLKELAQKEIPLPLHGKK